MNKRIFFFILVLISYSIYCQTAFRKTAPVFPTFRTLQISKTDDNHIIIGGDSPLLTRLNLNDFTFTTSMLDTVGVIISMQFVDSLNGWGASAFGKIWKTTDGGGSWQRCTVNYSSEFASLHFTGKDTGWVVGPQTILRSTDGGLNWHIFTSHSMPPLYRIRFKDSYNGFVSSYNGKLFKTTDAGRTWADIFRTNDLITDICYISDSVIVACTDSGRILSSGNAGVSWREFQFPNRRQLNKIAFQSADFGVCTDNAGNINITTNGGNSWNTYTSFLKRNIFSFQFIKNRFIIFADTEGALLTTADSGKSWNIYTETTNTLYAVRKFKAGINILCGEKGTITTQKTDGTKSELFRSPTNNVFVFKDIAIPDSSTLVIAATNGYILHSQSGGTTWNFINTGLNQQINKLFFISKSVGWFVAAGGGLGYTTDSGLNWVLQNTIMGIDLNSIYFINPDTGWAVGAYGMLKTTNHGLTWEVLPEWMGNFKDVCFTDALVGYTVTDRGDLFRTIDGGINWTMRSFFNASFNGVFFTSGNNGWVIGKRGTILKTIDGGISWSRVESSTTEELNSILFMDSLNGVICGANGLILRTNNGGITFFDEKTEALPGLASSPLAYPNPFFSETTIKYTLSHPEKVKLTVFNSLGQFVETIVNREQQAGEHTEIFNGVSKPSGIYFYKLIFGKESFSGKLLLVK